MNFIVMVLIGGFIGWIAGAFLGEDHSMLVNVIIGLLGSSFGGFLFGRQGKLLGFILTSVVGAILLVTILHLFLNMFPNLIR